MEVFEGEKKRQVKTRFGEGVRIVRNPLTKIPDRVSEINVFPAVLKEGTIPLTKENVDLTFKEFLKEHKELFGVEPENLKLVSANKIKGNWYVKYSQYYKGIPVFNATVGLDSSESGKVNYYASSYYPNIDIPTEPKISLERAAEIAKETYEKNNSQKLKEKETSLIIYPEKIEGKIAYYLAWRFLLAGDQPDPELEKYFIVDALVGKIILSYAARFPGYTVSGKVEGEIYPANPTNAVTAMPYRNQYVKGWFLDTTTDKNGNFKENLPFWSVFWILGGLLFGAWPYAHFRLDGPYARVQNFDGSNYEVKQKCSTSQPCNFTWTATDRDHINVFYHMNLFHDWLLDELGYSWINHWDSSDRFRAQVNHSANNAWSGNPMIFGNDPFARSSDVICHECTHNILCAIYGGWIGWPKQYSEAYAMDEGFADYFACSFTNDSRHGEGYTNNPRDLNNTEQYVGKANYNIEGHTGGMIIGGAAWDLRQRLVALQGVAGARIADRLLLEAHQILSTFPRDYYFSDPHESNFLSALYRAADDNHNLQDGFPHALDIQDAFHAHNLLQAVLYAGDSFDFSTNMIGWLSGGDLYYANGKFWANNKPQQGVIDLGAIAVADLANVGIPNSGYTTQGVPAEFRHTYVAKAQKGEEGWIVFRVESISENKSNVRIRYFRRVAL